MLLTSAAPAQQSGRIVGVVTDAISGRPLDDAVITIVGSGITIATDVDGRFEFAAVSPGLIKVSAQMLGYLPITTPYYTILPDSTTEVNFRLAPITVELDPVEVRGERETADWYFGASVLTADDLPARGDLVDALTGVIAGMRKTGGRKGRQDLAGADIRQSGTGVLWVVNGTVVEPPLQFYIDAGDVECIEVRKGASAALEYRRSINSPTYGGVILVWTKGARGPKPSQCSGKPSGG